MSRWIIHSNDSLKNVDSFKNKTSVGFYVNESFIQTIFSNMFIYIGTKQATVFTSESSNYLIKRFVRIIQEQNTTILLWCCNDSDEALFGTIFLEGAKTHNYQNYVQM